MAVTSPESATMPMASAPAGIIVSSPAPQGPVIKQSSGGAGMQHGSLPGGATPEPVTGLLLAGGALAYCGFRMRGRKDRPSQN